MELLNLFDGRSVFENTLKTFEENDSVETDDYVVSELINNKLD